MPYVLRVLMACHWMPYGLHNVAKATLLSRLLYASPSWWGMTSADESLKIERFINKSRRLGYLPANQPTMETMTDEADRRLLRAVVTCNNHVLMCLFPPIQATQYTLRPIGPITSNSQKKIALTSFQGFCLTANFSSSNRF